MAVAPHISRFAFYCIINPVVAIIGIFGNIICLIVCGKLWAKSEGLEYQIVIALGGLICLVAKLFHWANRWWIATRHPKGRVWIADFPAIVWYHEHLSSLLRFSLDTAAPLFTLVMCINRMFALYFPMSYRQGMRRNIFVIGIAGSLVVSLGVNIMEGFRIFTFIGNGSTVSMDLEMFSKETIGNLVDIRNTCGVASGFVILLMNVVILKKYRQLKANIHAAGTNEPGHKGKFTLLFVQSVLVIVSQLLRGVDSVIADKYPLFKNTDFFIVFHDLATFSLTLEASINFPLYLGTSKWYRNSAKAIFMDWCDKRSTNVQQLSSVQKSGGQRVK